MSNVSYLTQFNLCLDLECQFINYSNESYLCYMVSNYTHTHCSRDVVHSSLQCMFPFSANYCGGCNADFYDENDMLLSCLEELVVSK